MLYDLSVSSPVPFSSLWRVLVPAGTADADNMNATLAECDELNSVTTNVAFVALPDRDEHVQAVCHKVCATTLAVGYVPRNIRRNSRYPKWHHCLLMCRDKLRNCTRFFVIVSRLRGAAWR